MNIAIRPLEENDAYTSVKWRNIPELWVHTKFKASAEITISNELEWIRKVIKDSTSARFAILANDTYVGNIYITGIEHKIGEYHIFIGEKDYWGKGIARTASVLILDYAKDVLKLDKITLEVRPENTAALHLYKSLGFVETFKKDGEFTIMELSLSSWSGDSRDKIKPHEA